MAKVPPLHLLSPPFPRTSLIGRDREIADARALLLDAAVPLLTLVGPGGVGKTRLALAVARQIETHFADGIIWVDLASLTDPALVPRAVATATGLFSVTERSVASELAWILRPRQTLLVLDNCEHLVYGVADLISALLASCPALQVLASSRAALHVHDEQVSPVEPLALPPMTGASWDDYGQSDAVRLFVARARSRRRSFTLTPFNAPTVAAVCRALDGLPLAIELAAAWMTILSPEAVLAQMTDRLSLLRDGPRDAPSRQQTMEAAITWSYDLLTSEEQALCRRLAVFTGGFTLDAVRAVAGDWGGPSRDIVRAFTTLVDQSLVRRSDHDGEPRFTILETIRAFSWHRLQASGEEVEARNRHTAHYRELVEGLETWLMPHLPDTDRILSQLEREYPNLRAALAWQQETNNVTGLLELAGSLHSFWPMRGPLHEGKQWLEWGLAQSGAVPPSTRAMGQLALSGVLTALHESLPAMALAQESLDFFRTQGDDPRSARAYEQAAQVALNLDDAAGTNAYIDGALTILAKIGDLDWTRRARSDVLCLRGIGAKNSGDLVAAEQHLRQVIALQATIAQESGQEHPYACIAHLAMGAVAHIEGELTVALWHYRRSLDLAVRFQIASCAAFTLARIAGMLATAGRWQEAAWLFGVTEVHCEQHGLGFVDGAWMLTRAFGLPQPWQGPEDFSGQPAGVRAEILRRSRDPLPPLPDLVAAAEYWAAGRDVPMAEAVAHARTVDLSILIAPQSIPVITKRQDRLAIALTRREHEVLALLCKRLTNAEIAEQLVLSRRTIEDYVDRILGKLSASNRREAAAKAARLGLVTPDLIPMYAAESRQIGLRNP